MASASRISAVLSALLALLLSGCADLPARRDPGDALIRTPSPAQGITKLPPAGPPRDRGRQTTPQTAPGRSVSLPESAGLWARLRSGFTLSGRNTPQVSREIGWLRRHPEHVAEIARRARPFLWFIVEAAEARHLPLELALLPAVESGFRPWARSRLGAAGLWQIMPATARALGLESTRWYDGRLDPLASTDAALTYLERMQRRFDGDWLLALAAYNAGPGVVGRAVERNRRRHRPADYWHLDLPPQTHAYVPRLLALSLVLAHPGDYGVHLPPLPDRPLLARVEIPAPLDIEVAARLAGTEPQTLRAFNPAYIAGHTPRGKTSYLLLPAESKHGFETRLADLDHAAWHRIRHHRVVPGDSLWRIARRYGTTLTALRRVNGLSSDRLKVGQELRLPDPDDATPPPTPHYVVRPGDNLWTIARRFGLDHRRIAAWNGLSLSRPLRPGQRLQLVPQRL